MPKLTKDDFTSLLAEGFHTAFRKASEHPTAHQIWMLIRHEFPNKEWGNVIRFVADGVWPALAPKSPALRKAPTAITTCNLEVVVMPNGEVICAGKTVGWVKNLGKYLTVK